MTKKNIAHQLSNKTTPKKRVALGMSGGVDSSVCAHLLTEQGYQVTGIYLECWRAPGCRTDQDRKDALKVALSLDMPFKVLDFKDTYKNKVVEYFFDEYQKGRTPNPDILCNKEIKFGLFYKWAMDNGYDYVATGHYAKSDQNSNQLLVPRDQHKDQTYFLYRITSEQLEHTLFPLANLTKDEVRLEAEKRNLHNATKKDSVGICFIGDINVHNFLKERLGENPGEVIDADGNVIGKHNGLWFYTVGQRHGFSINKKTVVKNDDGSHFEKHNIPPFYVIKKIPVKNQLMVGFGAQTISDSFQIEDYHWLVSKDEIPNELLVRIRHTGELHSAKLDLKSNQVTLETPIKGIAAGQSAVFYHNQNSQLQCLGGGVIKQ